MVDGGNAYNANVARVCLVSKGTQVTGGVWWQKLTKIGFQMKTMTYYQIQNPCTIQRGESKNRKPRCQERGKAEIEMQAKREGLVLMMRV